MIDPVRRRAGAGPAASPTAPRGAPPRRGTSGSSPAPLGRPARPPRRQSRATSHAPPCPGASQRGHSAEAVVPRGPPVLGAVADAARHLPRAPRTRGLRLASPAKGRKDLVTAAHRRPAGLSRPRCPAATAGHLALGDRLPGGTISFGRPPPPSPRSPARSGSSAATSCARSRASSAPRSSGSVPRKTWAISATAVGIGEIAGAITAVCSSASARRWTATPSRLEQDVGQRDDEALTRLLHLAHDVQLRAGTLSAHGYRTKSHPASPGSSERAIALTTVGMDDWGFAQLQPRLQAREAMPVGPLFCVINRRTCGRAWSTSAARAALRRRAARASVRRRFVPHQLRHAHAIGLARGACRSTSSNVSWATATWA